MKRASDDEKFMELMAICWDRYEKLLKMVSFKTPVDAEPRCNGRIVYVYPKHPS